MTTLHVDVEEDLMALLHQGNRPAGLAAREMIVFELYRRGSISSGKAGELLGITRLEFIHNASQAGIPYFDMTEDEWAAERNRSTAL